MLISSQTQAAQIFERLLSQHPDSTLIVNQRGMVCYANQAAGRFFQLSTGKMLHQPLLFPCSKEARSEIDVPVDGLMRRVEILTSTVEWEGQPAVLISLREITPRTPDELALQRKEGYYSRFFQSSPLGITVTRWQDGRIIDANHSLLMINEYEREDMIGRTTLDLKYWKDEEDRGRFLQELGAQGRWEYETIIFTKSGGQRHMLLSSEVIQINNEPHILTFQNNITQRKQTEAQLQHHQLQMDSLRKVDSAIISSIDLNLTLPMILEQVAARLEVDAADIFLYDSDAHLLKFAAGRGFLTEHFKNLDLEVGHGWAGKAAEERHPISYPASQFLPDNPALVAVLAAEGFITYYSVPLIAKGLLKGVLEVYFRKPFKGSPIWLNFLESLASQAAIAIDNAVLFRDLQKANQQLAQAYDATIDALAGALELRDLGTAGHTRRVTEMSVRLARLMGVGEEEIVHFRRGAMLHDIGKMAIPDHILFKPGPLNEKERACMHKHPVYAREILRGVDFLSPATDIPYYHHERWDGGGYPEGLKGEDIPLSARIFAVVDVWDALTSDRPYRRAWSREAALMYILETSGRFFDPLVVQNFQKIIT